MAGGAAACEFRVFAPRLESQRELLQKQGAFQSKEARSDTYFVVRGRLDASLKVRSSCLDLKLRRGRDGIMEMWEHAGQAGFPVGRSHLARFLDAAGVTLPLPRGPVGRDDLLSLARAAQGLEVVDVPKERRLYLLDGARTEFTEVEVAGTPLHSVAVEDPSAQAAARAVGMLGISHLPNTSYQRQLVEAVFGR